MKPSRFNIVIDTKDKDIFFIYNTLSGSILKIDSETLAALDRITDTKDFRQRFPNLVEQGFVFEDSIDEDVMFSVRMGESRYGDGKSEFMVAVTSACNLACPYCFKSSREVKDLEGKSLEKVVSFIKNMCILHRNDHVELHLFGGEPFVRPKITFSLIDEIKAWAGPRDMKFTFIIYTNGTFADQEIVDSLARSRQNIRYIHFTLDGPRNVHDSRRFYKGGQPSYDRIILALKVFKANDLYSVVRINVDRKNISDIPCLLSELQSQGLSDVPIGFSFIRNMTHACGGYKDAVDDSDPNRWLPSLWKAASDMGFRFVMKPDASYLYCSAFKNSSFIIDVDCSVYKCAGLQGIREHSVGTINDKGYLDSMGYRYYEFMDRDPLRISPCKDCQVLPVCGCGCAAYSYTKFGSYHHPNCFDRNIVLTKERMKIYLMKKLGEKSGLV
ncbi:MAG: radical SAM protein [Candidatus Woesearchaeota archaeon]